MHTLVFMDRANYKEGVGRLTKEAAQKYDSACYISFMDPYHIIFELLQTTGTDEKFIVVDASTDSKQSKIINEKTYVLPITSIFDFYLFLGKLISEKKIGVLLLDSVSSLIERHSYLPLKQMLTNMLLQAGSMRCSSLIVAFREHEEHEVVKHLDPFIARNWHY